MLEEVEPFPDQTGATFSDSTIVLGRLGSHPRGHETKRHVCNWHVICLNGFVRLLHLYLSNVSVRPLLLYPSKVSAQINALFRVVAPALSFASLWRPSCYRDVVPSIP